MSPTMRRDDGGATLRDAATIAAWLVGLYAAQHAIAAYFAQRALASLVIQAVVTEYVAGRLGVAWSDPLAPAPSVRDCALRALRGSGMAITAAALLLAAAIASGAGSFAPNTPSITLALVGAVAPAFVAMRDELTLRGLILRATPAGAGFWPRLAVCGGVALAAAWGEGGRAPYELGAALCGGVAYGALWLRDRGAWLPWGAHATFSWLTSSLASGAVLDLRPSREAGLGASPAVIAVAAVVAVLAALEAWRHRRKSAANVTGRVA